jgi:DNA repair protein RadC
MDYRFRLKTFSAVQSPKTDYIAASPRAAIDAIRAIYAQSDLDDYQEHFVILTLDAKARVSGYKILASGTETGCLVSPAMIFRAAFALGGSSVILAHNHPSGDPNPSMEDRRLTDRCKKSGETLGLPVTDHIILGMDSHHSIRSEGGW